MIDKFNLIQKKYIVLIGENAVDISLYLSKICSFNHKVLLLDLSSSKIILDIVSPDGQMENQNIHYASFEHNNHECQYDIIIVFSNEFKNIPRDYYSSDIYFFISSRKHYLVRLSKVLSHLNDVDNVFIVIRGNDNKDVVLKRMYLSGIPHEIISRTLFIKDSDNDNRVFRQMEYNSVFLYDNLSEDLKNFLSNIYKQIANVLFITRIPDEVRFKWVM